jgi:hypothetical protein
MSELQSWLIIVVLVMVVGLMILVARRTPIVNVSVYNENFGVDDDDDDWHPEVVPDDGGGDRWNRKVHKTDDDDEWTRS